jgi:trigger factor
VNVEIKEAGDARKVALVTFESEEVSDQENQVCKEFGRMANIPGFRKGKAPEQVIRKKYSKELKAELNRKVSTAAYEAVLEHKDIRVYSILKVDPGEIDSNGPTTVEVTVDIEPEFDLPDYEDYEFSINPTEVNEEEIEKEIDNLRDQRAAFEEVERAVEEGDYVKCSYEGTLDGVPVSDILPDKPMYGKQSNTWEEAGQVKGMGVEAIAKGIIGMKKEDKKEVEEDFADDFELAPLAGKKVLYSIEVHEVREKQAPPADDEEFLKALKAESIDELK